jgi:four helix bundle protein
MSTPEELLPRHGGYRNLKSFQVAQLVYDITVRFCSRYIEKKSRTTDQMVQAARSGVQNIAEGSLASATSKKMEIKLTQVARASLEELRLDYEDFLRHRETCPSGPGRIPAPYLSNAAKTADEVAAWIEEDRKPAPSPQRPCRDSRQSTQSTQSQNYPTCRRQRRPHFTSCCLFPPRPPGNPPGPGLYHPGRLHRTPLPGTNRPAQPAKPEEKILKTPPDRCKPTNPAPPASAVSPTSPQSPPRPLRPPRPQRKYAYPLTCRGEVSTVRRRQIDRYHNHHSLNR